MMRRTTRNAPEAGQGFEGNDQNTYKGEPIVMKTTAPRIAHAPDNEELASSRDSVLVTCVDESCAYFHQGHYADCRDPLFMHVFVGVTDPLFRVAVERLSTEDSWELSIEIRHEDMTPDQARRFSRALVRCSELAESLNAERQHRREVTG
jgi:hypothetical protein